jgi:S-adenosyl-L-methionine hydrolase (adenosine-forming)
MPSRRLPIVTLSTDVGPVYTAQMVGVLVARGVRPMVLAHDLPPLNVASGSFLFRQMASAFPSGSVHLAVVDPGVGSERAAIAVRCKEGSYLVGPDNGLLIPLAGHWKIDRVVRLDPTLVVPDQAVSATFEGRDLLAPAAARLATGIRIETLGSPWSPQPSALTVPQRKPNRAQGWIRYIDPFGTLITDVPNEWLPESVRQVGMSVRGRKVRTLPVRRTYMDSPHGELAVRSSSFGTLELSAREARAVEVIPADLGLRVSFEWSRSRAARDGK